VSCNQAARGSIVAGVEAELDRVLLRLAIDHYHRARSTQFAGEGHPEIINASAFQQVFLGRHGF
jgi:hypothetical protein